MSSTENDTWHKIAESIAEINFSANGLAELEVKGKKFCVGLYNNQIFACTQKCPHAGGLLAEGYIDAAGNIVCPMHRYKFNPVNGRNISGEGYCLKIYNIEVKENGVYVSYEERLF